MNTFILITFIALFLWLLSEFFKLKKRVDTLSNKTTSEERATDLDELFQQAKEYIKTKNTISATLLQRKFLIGYATSARLLEKLEEEGLVGPASGVSPRQVIDQRQMVFLKDLWKEKEFNKNQKDLITPFGKDLSGKAVFGKLFHLLMAGATNSGKTVFLHSLIQSLMQKFTSEELKFVLVDHKRVELLFYEDNPYLLRPVIIETKDTLEVSKELVKEIEKRFELLTKNKERDIESYNKKAEVKMPYIIFVIDEVSDVMFVARKEFEKNIKRIVQLGKAAGIYVVLSTSAPRKDVYSLAFMSNFVDKLIFSLITQEDSERVLGLTGPGAEMLSDRGDALLWLHDMPKPLRIQTPFISDQEVWEDVGKKEKGKNKPKIAVFDDELMVQRIYVNKYKENNFEVIAFDYPPDNVIDIIVQEKPDIIHTDIVMPHMDGFTFLQRLKADERTKNIPVVIVSNLAQDSDFEEGRKLGAIKYLIASNLNPSQIVQECLDVLKNK